MSLIDRSVTSHSRFALPFSGGIFSFLLMMGMTASSHANLNRLFTDTFSYSDLHNHAHYTASSVNLGGGFSVSANKPQTEGQTENPTDPQWMQMQDSASPMPGIVVPQKGKASSITRFGVSDGTLIWSLANTCGRSQGCQFRKGCPCR